MKSNLRKQLDRWGVRCCHRLTELEELLELEPPRPKSVARSMAEIVEAQELWKYASALPPRNVDHLPADQAARRDAIGVMVERELG